MDFKNAIQYQVSGRNKVNNVQQESQLSQKNYMNDSKQFMSSQKLVVRKVKERQFSTRMRIFTQKNYVNCPKQFKALHRGNLFQNNYTLVEEIKRVKNDIDNYKFVSTAIGLKIRENDSRLNFNLNRVNEKEFSYNLRLKHKRLVNKAKEYKKNNEISNV
ncbi:26607_t:CDS:2, partial [Dentiscutata erythropus]